MASIPAAIDRLQLSVIDGRAENVRYRQDQLHALHRALRAEADGIRAALRCDTGFSAAEVEVECALALEGVRHFYETLDFQRDLQDEYSVARGKEEIVLTCCSQQI